MVWHGKSTHVSAFAGVIERQQAAQLQRAHACGCPAARRQKAANILSRTHFAAVRFLSQRTSELMESCQGFIWGGTGFT